MKRKILPSILLITLFLTTLLSIIMINAFASDDIQGLKPSATGRIKYTLPEKIEALPLTYEITVKIPDDYENATTILSTKSATTRPAFKVWINANKNPAFTLYEDLDKLISVVFDEVNLATNEWEHISIVINKEHTEVRCYLNGSLAGTKAIEMPKDLILQDPILVGGEYNVKSFFDGGILNLAIFSCERTSEEIKSDYESSPCGDGIICHYDFSSFDNSSPAKLIPDLSKSKNDLKYFEEFYDEQKNELQDYAYSIALVGDIQVVNYKYPEKLKTIYNWIKENKDDKKIAFAINLGDITDKNTAAEWENADEAIHTLDGVIPYSIVRGNHDKSLDEYNEHFSYADHEYMLDGSYDGTMLNTYQTFTVSGNKYLVLNLDFKMDFLLLDWANQVVSSHPDYNVIVTTHMYLSSDGMPLDKTDSLSPSKYKSSYDSDQLWEKFYSKHKNITMVISGHIGTYSIISTQREGIHGNTVTQILVDPQGMDGYYSGGLGLVAMLYFSGDGRTVQTAFYSTIREKLFLTSNEYQITLDTIQSGNEHTSAHNFNKSYGYNIAVHWDECICGVKSPTEEHIYDNITITKEATEAEVGEKTLACVCGYSITESYEYIPPKVEENNAAAIIIIISITSALALTACGFLIYKLKFSNNKTEPANENVKSEEENSKPKEN